MELTGLNKSCDPSIPNSFCLAMNEHKIERADFWYVWSYMEHDNYCKPIHLGERFIQRLEDTRITLKNNYEVSLMDLIETLLTHPEEVTIDVR